jgi:hypothetical protein
MSNQEIFSQQGGGLVPDITRPLTAAMGTKWNGNGDLESSLIPEVCATLTAKMQGASNQWAPMNEANHLIPELILPETTGTIYADSHPGSYTGQDAYTGRLIPSVVAFDTTQISSPSNYSNPQPGDPCHPLAAEAHPPAIAFERRMVRTTGGQPQEELCHCLRWRFNARTPVKVPSKSPPPCGP